jgi:hypothetical protein
MQAVVLLSGQLNMELTSGPSQIDCRGEDLAEVWERRLTVWDTNLTSGDIERTTVPTRAISIR